MNPASLADQTGKVVVITGATSGIGKETATALAQIDVLGAFAETARLYNYCCPQIGAEGALLIRDGRHRRHRPEDGART